MDNLTVEQARYLAALHDAQPVLSMAYVLAQGFMGLLRERMEGYGEPGGSPRFREEGGGAEFAQDRNSLARIPVAEMRGETWFPP